MTPRAGHLNTAASHQAAAPGRCAGAPDLPDESCRRCGGFLVADFSASLACDITGTLVTLWRCVNCGDCMDRFILANRSKSPMPARRRARPPAGPHAQDGRAEREQTSLGETFLSMTIRRATS